MRRSITKGVLFVIALVGLCAEVFCGLGDEKSDIVIVSMPLDPTNTKHLLPGQREQRMYEPARFPTRCIVLHYAVTTTIDQTINAYYGAGVSAHFTVDKDGAVYEHVDTDREVAYHAGQSFWHGRYHLNWYSVGVEQVNTGSDVSRPCWKEPLISGDADGRRWEVWSDQQVNSVALLVKELADKHGVMPWNILGHSDCACGRKIDPGPLFPWKRLYAEYQVGFWPDEDEAITVELVDRLVSKDYMIMLMAIGYPAPGFAAFVENVGQLGERRRAMCRAMSERLSDREAISAFQYHYMQDKLESEPEYRSGNLDEDTKLMILKCIKSLIAQVPEDDYSLKVLTESDLSSEARAIVDECCSLRS